jgi:hypothetical protein
VPRVSLTLVAKILPVLGGVAIALYLSWCIAISMVGGTIPLVGWTLEGGFWTFAELVSKPQTGQRLACVRRRSSDSSSLLTLFGSCPRQNVGEAIVAFVTSILHAEALDLRHRDLGAPGLRPHGGIVHRKAVGEYLVVR